jgi:hypothetical protein
MLFSKVCLYPYFFINFPSQEVQGNGIPNPEKAQGTSWKGGWAGPGVNLDVVEERKLLTVP